EGKAEDGVSLILVPKGTRGLQVKLLPTMDQTRKLCEVSFQDTAVPADALMGVKGKAWPTLTRVVERATVALCAEMCGGAQRVLDMTTDYAKIRIAFTWDHDLHLYFKRAKSSEFTFGDATYHRERVAQLINL